MFKEIDSFDESKHHQMCLENTRLENWINRQSPHAKPSNCPWNFSGRLQCSFSIFLLQMPLEKHLKIQMRIMASEFLHKFGEIGFLSIFSHFLFTVFLQSHHSTRVIQAYIVIFSTTWAPRILILCYIKLFESSVCMSNTGQISVYEHDSATWKKLMDLDSSHHVCWGM